MWHKIYNKYMWVSQKETITYNPKVENLFKDVIQEMEKKHNISKYENERE